MLRDPAREKRHRDFFTTFKTSQMHTHAAPAPAGTSIVFTANYQDVAERS
jgi:hypothetical protein